MNESSGYYGYLSEIVCVGCSEDRECGNDRRWRGCLWQTRNFRNKRYEELCVISI